MHTGCRQLWLVLSFAAALFVPVRAVAQEPGQVQRDLLVLARALAYDRTLPERFGTEIRFGVLHEGAKPKDEAAQVVAVLGALHDVKIGGLAVSVVALPWTNAEALATTVTEGEVDVIYVPKGLDEGAVGAQTVGRAASRTTMTRHRPYVEAGLSLAVEEVDGKPRIVMNMVAARDEGASYNSELLRLADIVK